MLVHIVYAYVTHYGMTGNWLSLGHLSGFLPDSSEVWIQVQPGSQLHSPALIYSYLSKDCATSSFVLLHWHCFECSSVALSHLPTLPAQCTKGSCLCFIIATSNGPTSNGFSYVAIANRFDYDGGQACLPDPIHWRWRPVKHNASSASHTLDFALVTRYHFIIYSLDTAGCFFLLSHRPYASLMCSDSIRLHKRAHHPAPWQVCWSCRVATHVYSLHTALVIAWPCALFNPQNKWIPFGEHKWIAY